jgi:peptide subunit release factor 1 (eRF1)
VTRVLAVVTDRAHARFFDVGASGAVELTSLQSPAGRGDRFHSDRADSPGWGEHAYHARRREEARRHRTAIVERLAAFEQQHPDADVLLAGPGTAAGVLRSTLPPALGERVIGTAKLSPLEVTPAIVHRTAIRLSRMHERAEQRALVTAVLEGLGNGRAENGARAVLRALAKRQVRTLVVRADVRADGFRCGGSGRLVLSAADCRGEGDPMPVPDLFQAAAEEARRQGATVTFLDDRDAARPIEGLAALLRWQ